MSLHENILGSEPRELTDDEVYDLIVACTYIHSLAFELEDPYEDYLNDAYVDVIDISDDPDRVFMLSMRRAAYNVLKKKPGSIRNERILEALEESGVNHYRNENRGIGVDVVIESMLSNYFADQSESNSKPIKKVEEIKYLKRIEQSIKKHELIPAGARSLATRIRLIREQHGSLYRMRVDLFWFDGDILLPKGKDHPSLNNVWMTQFDLKFDMSKSIELLDMVLTSDVNTRNSRTMLGIHDNEELVERSEQYSMEQKVKTLEREIVMLLGIILLLRGGDEVIDEAIDWYEKYKYDLTDTDL